MKKLLATVVLLMFSFCLVSCGYEESPIEGVSLEVYEATVQMLEHIETEAFITALDSKIEQAGYELGDLELVMDVTKREVEAMLAEIEPLCKRKEDKHFYEKVARVYAFAAAGTAMVYTPTMFSTICTLAVFDSDAVKVDIDTIFEWNEAQEFWYCDDLRAAARLEDLSYYTENELLDDYVLLLTLGTYLNVD